MVPKQVPIPGLRFGVGHGVGMGRGTRRGHRALNEI